MRLFLFIFKRDMLLAVRRRRELANPLVFFIMVVSMFPLGVTPDHAFLAELSAGVIWVTG